jgi:exonuclease III
MGNDPYQNITETISVIEVYFPRNHPALLHFSALFRWADAYQSLLRRGRRSRGTGETVHGEALAGGQMKEALS